MKYKYVMADQTSFSVQFSQSWFLLLGVPDLTPKHFSWTYFV